MALRKISFLKLTQIRMDAIIQQLLCMRILKCSSYVVLQKNKNILIIIKGFKPFNFILSAIDIRNYIFGILIIFT